MGRNQNEGQIPSAPGAIYATVLPLQSGIPLVGCYAPLVPAGPMQPRSNGQSPVRAGRIVDGAQGLQLGLSGIMQPLNALENQTIRVLTPPEFFDTMTDTQRNPR